MKLIDKNACNYKLVNLISLNGEKLGVMEFDKALQIADNYEIATVNENSDPPIVKIIDYGKILYAQKKNLKKQRSNVIKNKEIKFGITIAENDYNVKIKKIKDFIAEGDRVKASLYLKFREASLKDAANEFMEKLKNDLSDIASTSDNIELIGNCISLNFTKKTK